MLDTAFNEWGAAELGSFGDWVVEIPTVSHVGFKVGWVGVDMEMVGVGTLFL